MDEGQPFWAFISYSHKDTAWAAWLQRGLERYSVPWRLVGRETAAGPAPRRFRPIFRDRGDLAADPDLRRSVGQVLGRCGFLIVVCSPAAVASPWVEDEIVQFKRLHGEARILPVIVAGEPNIADHGGRVADECFPRALRHRLDAAGEIGAVSAEPVAADLRPGGDGRRGALLKLLAGMLGVGLDELIRRDSQRRVAQLTAMTAGAFVAVLAMGALTLLAVAERNEAQRRQAQAEDLVEFMLSDLPGKLEPYDRLDALDAVARKALAYYADQSGLGSDAAARRARALQLMGDLSQRRGDAAAAGRLFAEAAANTATLLARDPDNPQRIFDHAQSEYWLGELAETENQLDAAAADFALYRRLAGRLLAVDPGNERSSGEVAYADETVGSVQLLQKRPDLASANFASALAVFEVRAAGAPGVPERQFDLAQGHAWLADAKLARRDAAGALAERLRERAIYTAMLAVSPDEKRAAYSLASNREKVAAIYLAEAKPALAAAELAQARALADRLVAAGPDNADYRRLAVDIAALSKPSASRSAGR
jgi:hypothetical protein